MTDTNTAAPRPVVVTLDLTDDDVSAVLVNSLREAARAAAARAEREGEYDAPDADWADDQERIAQIAQDLVTNIETQLDALSTAATKDPS